MKQKSIAFASHQMQQIDEEAARAGISGAEYLRRLFDRAYEIRRQIIQEAGMRVIQPPAPVVNRNPVQR